MRPGIPKMSIIDDTLQNPDDMIAEAEKRQYNITGPYAGKTSEESPDSQLTVSQELVEIFCNVVRSPRIWWPNPGCFRLALAEDKSTDTRVCHTDNQTKANITVPLRIEHYTGILYLSTGGCINFFYNKASGRDYIVDQRDRGDLYGSEAMTSPDQWEKWLSIPIVKNRLLVFRSNLFHQPGTPEGYGSDFKTGKLLRAMWFYPGEPPADYSDASLFD